jgi:nucleoside-diphosphate kinase
MATEETLVLVKPDGVARGLTGAILARIEAKGYSLVDIRLVEPDRGVLERHYAEHEGKPFYEPLLEFMMSGPSVAIRLAGNRVIEGFRSLAGTTDPTTAAPGTVRGDFGRDWGLKVQQNLVHGSGQSRVCSPRTRHLVRLSGRSHSLRTTRRARPVATERARRSPHSWRRSRPAPNPSGLRQPCGPSGGVGTIPDRNKWIRTM